MPGSTDQGRKKALCIGINYRGNKELDPLEGSINDARAMVKFLCDERGYKRENIVILTDEDNDATQRPTRKNIIKAMNELVKDARPNDHFFFHYSGHGKQVADDNGDESDNQDESMQPMDFMETQKDGTIVDCIRDDEIHAIMVEPLPAGCRLTAVIDSCHSGTGLDLPYVYDTNGRIKQTEPGVKQRYSNADVFSWSGCKDSEYASDFKRGDRMYGAMCDAFIAVLRSDRHRQFSYREVLVAIREEFKKTKFAPNLPRPPMQTPQLSSSHEMNLSLPFVC